VTAVVGYKDLSAQVGGFRRSSNLTLARQFGFLKAGTPDLIRFDSSNKRFCGLKVTFTRWLWPSHIFSWRSPASTRLALVRSHLTY
jgi:hypothetical protein